MVPGLGGAPLVLRPVDALDRIPKVPPRDGT